MEVRVIGGGSQESSNEGGELRKELADAGLSAYEKIQELEFDIFYAMSAERSKEKSDAWDKWLSADRKPELAESRLKAAESEELPGSDSSRSRSKLHRFDWLQYQSIVKKTGRWEGNSMYKRERTI